MQDLKNKIIEVTLAQPYINLKVPTIFLKLEDKFFEHIVQQQSDANADDSNITIMAFEKVCELAKPLGLVTPLEVSTVYIRLR